VPDWEGGFKANALVRPDGSFVPQYGKPKGDDSPYPCSFYLMCANAKGWQHYLHHYIVEKYVRQYGVDHMYVDQLGAARAQWCFARGHGHDDAVGAWSRGNMEKFRRFKQDGRKTEPAFSLSTEGFGDAYMQYVDAFLLSPASTRVWRHSAPEVVRYTFPQAICFDGFANGNRGGPAEEVVCKVFLLGNRFDLFARPGPLAEFCTQAIRLRQETAELLYRGTFRDEIGLIVSDPRVRAKLWRLDHPDATGWVVNFWNPDRVASARLRVATGGGHVARAFVASLGHTMLGPCSLDRGEGTVAVAVPAERLGSVLLLERSKPCLLRAWQALTPAGARSDVEVRFRPLGPGLAPEGMAEVAAPKGWRTEPVRFATAASSDVAVPVAVPPTARLGGQKVKVRVSAGAFRWERELGLLVVEPYEVSVRAAGRDAVVRIVNRCGEAAAGRCSVSSAALGLSRSQAARVPGGGEAEVVFRDALGPRPTKRVEVQATFQCGDARAQATVVVEPPDLSAGRWRWHVYEHEAAGARAGEGGGEALSIESNDPRARASWAWTSTALPVGSSWTLSAECRTASVVSKDGGARVRIIFYHRSKPVAGAAPWVLTQPIRGSAGWTRLRCPFTVPPECGRVQIELFLWHAAGKAEWRGMRLE